MGEPVFYFLRKNMKDIVGFGALNLDLIFEVEDFKSISSKFIGKVGEDEEGDFILESLKPVQINLV